LIRAEYEEKGVALAPRLLTRKELVDLEAALESYRRDVLPRLPKEDFVLESDGVSVRNLWRMQLHDAWFRRLVERADFLELAAELVRGDPVPMSVEVFWKPARVGSAVPLHQDNAYFCRVPADVFTLWIAIDPVTPENGAVEYLSGSHLELLPHEASGVAGNSFALRGDLRVDLDAFDRYQPSLAPGDALLHHSQVIHRSLPNTSDHSRRALVIVYRGAHTEVDAKLESAYLAAQSSLPQS